LQHALARQPGAQQQRQQLGVGQRRGTAGEQLLARAGVGGQVFEGVQGWPRKIAASLSPGSPISRTAVTKIQPGSFLTLHYRLAGPDGAAVVDTFAGPPATLSLGTGELAPAMEARLIGLPEGARQSIELAAGVAFGARNPELLQRVKLSLLHELGDPEACYAVGDVVQFPTPEGQGSYAGVVRQVGDGWLLFDFNHPLAGQPVRLDVHVIGVL
jgi:FKBP-type peptidyl-prolyl cis-trans isomerase SlpA